MISLLRALSPFAAAWLLASTGALAASAPVTDDQLAPLTAAYVRAVKPGEQAEMHRELFGTVLRRIQRTYAQDVEMSGLIAAAMKTIAPLEPRSGEPAEVFKKAINAALATLDPHSRYLDPRAQNNHRSSMAGSFSGLGLQVEMADGLVRVVAPMPDSPAARGGLRTGDLIVRFDDQSVLGMALTDAVSRIRGEPGTPIALTIRRAGHEDEFTITLIRDTIRTQALRWTMEGDVLVLRLASFTSTVSSMLEKALAEVSAMHTPRAIVLDMRGNPGGLLNQAVRTADTFLSAGEIVSLRGRTPGNRRSWQADAIEHLPGIPMVVLVNSRSASAAELVAAALQENGRAWVMGQRSFGKGSVQSIVSLGADKGALSLTTALYHGPSGRTVQRMGVGPDIELIAEAAATSPRREVDRPRALPGADEPLPPKARVEQARCARPQQEIDPALACALAFLKAGGVEKFVVGLELAEAHAVR